MLRLLHANVKVVLQPNDQVEQTILFVSVHVDIMKVVKVWFCELRNIKKKKMLEC